MTWSADPELQQMFLGELDERSSRLLDGARAMRSGGVTPEMAGAMMREGHTVKGTSRVMGYRALSAAGQFIEHIWRAIQKGEMTPGVELARALEMAARALAPAGRADPDVTTHELAEALAWLEELVPDFDMPELPATAPSAVAVEPAATEDGPLGGGPRKESPGAAHGDDRYPEVSPSSGETHDETFEAAHGDDRRSEEAWSGDDATKHTEGSGDARGFDGTEELGGEAGAADPSEAEVGHGQVGHGQVGQESPPLTVVADNGIDAGHGEGEADSALLAPVGEEEPAGRARRSRHRPQGELGLLVTAVERWAGDHTMMVNAGRLFEMVNLIADLRLEAEAMTNRVSRALSDPEGATAAARGAVEQVQKLAEALQVQALAMTSAPFHQLSGQLAQVAKFVAGRLGRSVSFDIVADDELAVDREVIEHLTEVVRQLVVNAVYHGIEHPAERVKVGKPETGRVTVTAVLKDRMLELTVSDDGSGIDWDLVRAIAVEDGRLTQDAPLVAVQNVVFEEGFTTETSDDGVGQGKGLEFVARTVEGLYGRIVLTSTRGSGTQVRLTVPAWRSLQRLLVVEAAGVGWGVPEAAVDEMLPIDEIAMEGEAPDVTIPWRGERIPVRSLASVMGDEDPPDPTHVVVLRHRLGGVALAVDVIEGVREVAVKELSPVISAPAHVAGAAFLGGDDVVLVLHPGSLVTGGLDASASIGPAARVLVVDDSMGARAVVSGSLASSGFTTSVAASVAEALEVLEQISVDALVVDYAMPNADGVALVEQVRKLHEHLPIVMLSGVADEDDRERARNAGVDAFFDKASFREGELAQALWEMVGG